MIYNLDLKYNPNEAMEYYEILKKEFQHYHWEYKKHHNDPNFIDPKNHLADLNGWGLQTIYNDPTFPYQPDLDPHDEGPEYFKDTPMVFGFFKRAKDKLIDPFRSFLMTSPSGHYIDWCITHAPHHGVIFIPITVNDETYFRSKYDLDKKYYLKLGQIFLIDPSVYAFEFRNQGSTAVTGIQISVPTETFNHVFSLKGTI
jgi:hypothetical protein